MSTDPYIITEHKDGTFKNHDEAYGFMNAKGFRDNISQHISKFEHKDDIKVFTHHPNGYCFGITIFHKEDIEFIERVFKSEEVRKDYFKHYEDDLTDVEKNETYDEQVRWQIEILKEIYTDDVVSLEVSTNY